MARTKWNIAAGVSDKARLMSSEYKISSIASQILLNRGYDTDSLIKEFLFPDISKIPSPFLLSGMKEAVKRIHEAIINKEKICIYGDYDIDGITSIVVLKEFLDYFGLEVLYYQPERSDEGYGLHLKSISKIFDSGVKLIITVDCGSSDYESAIYCKEKNIDLIITDHHKTAVPYPEAYAFINPHKEGEEECFKCLAGVGVAFYLLIALRMFLREEGVFNSLKEPNLFNFLDLVAFGTISDVAPLNGINRILVKRGLELLNGPNIRQGFNALKKISGLDGKVLTAESISYNMAPRMNAAGRMGDASKAVELLLEKDIVRSILLAKKLDEENFKRITLQNEIWDEINLQVNEYISKKGSSKFEDKKTLVFYSKGWHQGVLGIIASKVTEKWNKPSIVLTVSEEGKVKGSARSTQSVDIYKGLSCHQNLFESFGGHAFALGMSLDFKDLTKLEKVFEKYVMDNYSSQSFEAVTEVDLEINFKELSLTVLDDLAVLEPFGYGNTYPVFASRKIRILDKWLLKDKHLKLKLANGIEAIGFNLGDYHEILCDTVDLLYKPVYNEWKGAKKLQFILLDID